MRYHWHLYYYTILSYTCSFSLTLSAVEVINSSDVFVQKLCNSSDSDTILILNSSITYDIKVEKEGFCIIDNANITIISHNKDRTGILCSLYTKLRPTRGIAFVNSTVTIRDISISNCGARLTALPSNITDMFNSSSLYYPINYSAVLLFIHSQVNLNNVKMVSSYGFAIIGINLDNSVIHNCSFSSFVSLVVNTQQNIIIGNGVLVHFFNDTSWMVVSSRNVTISDSSFIWNTAHSTSNSTTSHCISDVYSNNKGDSSKPVMFSVGITILYTYKEYEAKVNLIDLNFSNNVSPFTTSLLILHYKSLQNDQTVLNSVTLKTLSIYNKALCPESAEFSFIFFPHANGNKTYTPLAIHNSLFRSQPQKLEFVNYPLLKNTIYIGVQEKMPQLNIIVTFNNSEFWDNFASGHDGCLKVYSKAPLSLILNSVYFHRNRVKMVSQIASFSGIIVLRGDIDLIINGTETNPSVFKNNYGRVIHAFNKTNVYLHGHVIFKSNKALSGSAINLESNCRLHFTKESSVLFEENQSVGLGGAIYAVTRGGQEKCALFIENSEVVETINITFINNSALQGGSNIYAFPIFNCNNGVTNKAGVQTYENIFNFKTNLSKNLLISTLPSNFSINYFNKSGTTGYPGQAFSACLTAMDVLGRSVYGMAIVNLLPKIDDELLSQDWLTSGSDQQVIEENEQCTNVSIKLHSRTIYLSKKTKPRNIMLYLKDTVQYHTFPMFLDGCPHGFKLDVNSGSCACSQVLLKYNTKCSIQTQTFSKLNQANQWAGVITEHNRSQFAISLNCPIGYCTANAKMKMFYTNDSGIFLRDEEGNSVANKPVCVKGREGPLCGKCSEGLTAVFGTAKCVHCNPDTYYWLIGLLTLLVGPFLILMLFALKLTLTAGTINGIIFYANFVNTGLLQILSDNVTNHTESILNSITLGFLTILNLQNGVSVCFFKGMNQFWKAGFSLVFPYYLLLLVGIIILISRCSSWVSKHTSHSSVQVLVTVVHLSFSNLLLTIVTVFSSTVLYTDNDKYRVWTFDGSVLFLADRRHQALAIISSITTFPLILLYLFFLVLTKPLMKRFSKCNLYLRPIYEAIHAPYKEGKEYWFVMRLLMLMFACIFWPFKTPADSGLVFIITALLLCVFLLGQAIFRPHKNRQLGLLDNWTLLNLMVVYISLLLPQNNIEKTSTVLLVTASLMLVTFTIVIMYHFLMVTGLTRKISNCFGTFSKSRYMKLSLYKISDFFVVTARKKSTMPLDPVDKFNETCDQYREPLLEDY